MYMQIDETVEWTFCDRHIGPDNMQIAQMLEVVGVADIDTLIAQTVPEGILDRSALGIGAGLSESEALEYLRRIAAKNRGLRSLIGQGYYGSRMPAVIQRNVLENPAWYTAYTPYQPEISQGRLEALLNFQTLVCDLTGLDVANASLLDEATAAAEAMALAKRNAKTHSNAFFVDRDCMPQTIAVLRTRAEPLGWEILIGDPETDLDPANVFGALLQYPGASGVVRDFSEVISALTQAGALSAVAADPLALVLLKTPGEMGADIAIGSMQRFGLPMGCGGPHAAYMAVRKKLTRSLPGRLVGVSLDSHGKPALRLALQTREQHIRREKATSNICTAQVLLAILSSMYAVYHGPTGLHAIASQVHRLTQRLAAGLVARGVQIANDTFFDTLTIRTTEPVGEVHDRTVEAGINLRRIDDDHIGISLDETCDAALVDTLLELISPGSEPASTSSLRRTIPSDLLRQADLLEHRVFSRHRSETSMLRYLRQLADKDLALDRTMIPLGSCTMKLNATTEMLPITWPEFGNIHPFAPDDQLAGYREMFAELQAQLCAVSGYHAVSLQPNSGAQGELAGLLAIRRYHRDRGDTQRNICLIPSSAHGTNPASAQLAGMDVKIVSCDDAGNIDLDDLDRKIEATGDRLAAIMITYPSTHGVFEAEVRQICEKVHAVGGQVYLDGANLNAQVGLSRPGHYGADVSHFNLHKTFCIPHGGGGPGMGPIGVKQHLAPFLPTDPRSQESGAVSAAPAGSASILPISYLYILMMGDEGLKRATEIAILNTNYIAERLKGAYPILYAGPNGRVAHECILDLRKIKEETGVSVDDVAKRLIDYGFHAPTMSFPVAGTLMVEPTESEDKAELDRFCDAMLAIRAEIDAIADGQMTADQSPLHFAPHTIADLVGKWDRPYSRNVGSVVSDRYWPPVNRIDNVHGDRNLMCSCPPLSAYEEAE